MFFIHLNDIVFISSSNTFIVLYFISCLVCNPFKIPALRAARVIPRECIFYVYAEFKILTSFMRHRGPASSLMLFDKCHMHKLSGCCMSQGLSHHHVVTWL